MQTSIWKSIRTYFKKNPSDPRELRRLFFNPWFWSGLIIFGFFLAHIPHITTPPIDQHAWRQTDTAAVARNFGEESANIFFPRIDMRGANTGITGMEFPIYNYAIFITNLIFGFAHWHGRVISLLASLVGMGFFFAFTKERYGQLVALASTFAFASMPLWFYFSRNIQPDASMVAASIAALYFAQIYSKQGQNKDLYCLIASITVACLIKIPAIFIGIPILYILGPGLIKNTLTKRNITLAILFFVLPVALWYLQSDYLSKHFGLGQYYYGELSLRQSFNLAKSPHFWQTLKYYILPFKASTLLLYVLMFGGGLYALMRRDWLPLVWPAAILLFLGVFANKSFYHNYYSLPLMPALSLLAGIGFSWFWRILKAENRLMPYVFAACYVALGAWVAYHGAKPLYAVSNAEYLNLEAVMDKTVPKKTLIITEANDPRMLYFSHRKGWAVPSYDFTSSRLKSLHREGAKFAVVDVTGNNLIDSLPSEEIGKPVYLDENFLVIQLN